MRFMSCLFLMSFFVVEASHTLAGPKQTKPADLLIEVDVLEKRLNDSNLRVLDTRSPADYAAGHIPGAVRVDVKAWQAIGKKEGGFHDAKAWADQVGALGISRETKVAVYGNNLTDTARIWWTLKYLGVQKVIIVNGGWGAWTKHKLPIDKTAASPKATKFEPKFQVDRLEEVSSLKKDIKGAKVKVVDARSEEEFNGKQLKGKKGGHIPGATHLEWKELLAEDGRFKTTEQLRKLFRERGILPDDTTICY